MRAILNGCRLFVFLAIFCHFSPALADREAAPYPYIVATPDGRSYFKMMPDTEAPYDHEKGKGIFYKVGTEKDDPQWDTRGWYAFETYVSQDGDYLVRLGNWPRGNKPSAKHLAIAFYKQGKLLKSYSTKDLIKNPTAIRSTVSHYGYRGKTVGFDPADPALFILETVEGIAYRFDVRTGKILHHSK